MTVTARTSGFLALADGTVYSGESVGADGVAAGEAVFTTGMSGYQEAVTDPSFAEQLVCFPAPMIGNYGVANARLESETPHARAAARRARLRRSAPFSPECVAGRRVCRSFRSGRRASPRSWSRPARTRACGSSRVSGRG